MNFDNYKIGDLFATIASNQCNRDVADFFREKRGRALQLAGSIVDMINADSVSTGNANLAWSIPRSMEDVLSSFDRKFLNQDFLSANIDNHRKYLKDLDKDNIIHHFSIYGIHTFCLEPCPMSWRVISTDGACSIYPESICRLIESGPRLVDMIITMAPNNGQRSSRDYVEQKFEQFIVDRVKKMHPAVKSEVPSMCTADKVYNVLKNISNFSGIYLNNPDISQLPLKFRNILTGATSDLDEIIPVRMPTKMSLLNNPGRERDRVKSNHARDNIDEDLHVNVDAVHFLVYYERQFRRYQKIETQKKDFFSIRNHKRDIYSIWDMLEAKGFNEDALIKKWICWYAAKSPEDITIKDLKKTWSKFKSAYDDGLIRNRVEGRSTTDIVNHMVRMFAENKSTAVENSLLYYGLILTYEYMLSNYGAEETYYATRYVFHEILTKLQTDDSMKDRVRRICDSTVMHGFDLCQNVEKDRRYINEVKIMLMSTGNEGRIMNKYFSQNTSIGVLRFWEYIRNKNFTER